MEIFEQASRRKLRFDTTKGQLTVEDLWDLPLTTTKPLATSLDDVARSLHRQLRNEDTISFVTPSAGVDTDKQLAFEIVKYIIDVRMAENEATRTRQAKAAQKQKLLEIIAEKQDTDLRSKSVDELMAMIDD